MRVQFTTMTVIMPISLETVLTPGSGTVNTYGGQTAIVPNYAGITNDNITWQETETWNLGLDGVFYNNRLFFNIDVYSRERLVKC
jgi:hypothetical protein